MKEFILLLVILNPFAQVLYLAELLNRFEPRAFAAIHLRATVLSFLVFAVFALWGDVILSHVFQVRLPSVQIFGGLIMMFLAYRYIVVGPGSNLLFRGDVSELAPQISLPYMVGPGTIWVSMLLGEANPAPLAVAAVGGVLAINFVCVCLAQMLYRYLQGKREIQMDKYLAILMRINALFVGAIGVEMIFSGVEKMVRVMSA